MYSNFPCRMTCICHAPTYQAEDPAATPIRQTQILIEYRVVSKTCTKRHLTDAHALKI
jgi:hypothetical protein